MGQDVDPGAQISIEFDSDISAMGAVEVSKAQIEKTEITPAVKCLWKYEGTRILKCTPEAKLTPDTAYKVTIKDGFTGAGVNNRISYPRNFEFRTNKIAVKSYDLKWDAQAVTGQVYLNYQVKTENLSGKIQCDDKLTDVKINVSAEKNIQMLKFSIALNKLSSPVCSFYFDKPLELKNFNVSSLPEQRIPLMKETSSVESPEAGFQLSLNCARNYNRTTNFYGGTIPSISCEFSDALKIHVHDGNRNASGIRVSPSDGIEVTGSHGGFEVSGFRADQTYAIVIPKDVSSKLKKDLPVLFTALNSPPLLGSKKRHGVLEKDGPWKIPFSAMNIKTATLDYEFQSQESELGRHYYFMREDTNFDLSETFPLNVPNNENHLLPLDFSEIAHKAKFKAGRFSGKVSVNEVDQKYEEARDELIEDNDGWIRRSREEFRFSYLVTDIGLHMKLGSRGAMIWATSLKAGKPIRGLRIVLYQNGVEKYSAESDAEGLATFPEVMKKNGTISVVASKGDDISFISMDDFWSRGISPYDFNYANYYEEESASGGLVADVVSERPLYLPAEKVKLKLFVRIEGDSGIELRPVGEKVNVTIHDSRGEEVHKMSADLNKYGTLGLEYQLEPKAPTGNYTVYISAGSFSANFPKAFQVQEFRKPEIKIAMDEDAKSYKGKVSYYSGGELAGASGEVAVIFRPVHYKALDPELRNMTFPAEVGGRFYEWDEYYGDKQSPSVLSREEIETDEKGEFQVDKQRILSSVNKYGHLSVEAIFKDSSGGKVSGRISTLVNPYKYLPGVRLGKWYYNAGEKVNPNVVIIDSQGKIASGVKTKLTVKRVTYNYERRLGSGNYFYYDYRKEESQVKECTFTSSLDLSSCEVPLKDGGTYTFSVKVVGEEELNPAVAETWVMKDNEYFGSTMENHDRINLSVESSPLKYGDKLRLMALSPFSDGEALITFEREGILHSERVSFKGNVIKFEKEIDDEKYIPGFYVSIVLVKGRTSDKVEGEVDLGRPQFKLGYARVEVVNLPKRLNVKVTPSRKQAKPGEMMEAKVEVRDYKGKGASSELAIAVVDESLLALSGNYKSNYDILDTFYTLKKNKFWNYNTLTQLIGRRTYGKKGANPGGGGGAEIRSDLKNTAYWIAQVETDSSGNHSFKFKIPDNLTTWKIIAVSVDDKHRFGFGENDFLATKPLTVEPNLPNFLVEGDKFQALVNVANRSGEALDVNLSSVVTGLRTNQKETSVKLKNGERSSLNIPMETESAPVASMLFTAKSAKHSDAIKVELPVERNSLSHVSFTNGYLAGKEISHNISLPQDARKDSLNMTVEYSHTALNGLDEVFKYVLGYPYGCWEQRLSKAYFLVQYEAFKEHISYRFPEKEGSIRDAVQKLLNLAPDYQTNSGGMQYYPQSSGEGDAYLSIFTAYSFVIMKKMGYKISSDVENKLKGYLKQLSTNESSWNNYYGQGSKNSNRALVLSVLTAMGEKNLSASGSKLYAERNSLDLFGLSFLGSFLQNTKGFEKEAKNVFDRLESLKTSSGNKIQFTEPVKTNDEWKWWSYTNTRSQCAVLQNLVPYTDDKVMAASFVREILGRMKDGHWYNTQENIYCFEGLRRFVEKFEKKNQDGVLTVKLDGNKISTEPKINKNVRQILVGPDVIKVSSKKVSLIPEEKSELYYSTTIRYETPYKERPPVDNGFSLSKSFSLKSGNKFTDLKGSILKLKKGDILKITLTVKTPSPRYHVLLNDRLAAAFEPVNMSLATSSEADQVEAGTKDPEEKRSPWFESNGFDYVDLRLNAAQFYAKKLQQGSWTVDYLVQVRVSGEFSLPESTIEEMYYPDIRGSYSGLKVIVE